MLGGLCVNSVVWKRLLFQSQGGWPDLMIAMGSCYWYYTLFLVNVQLRPKTDIRKLNIRTTERPECFSGCCFCFESCVFVVQVFRTWVFCALRLSCFVVFELTLVTCVGSFTYLDHVVSWTYLSSTRILNPLILAWILNVHVLWAHGRSSMVQCNISVWSVLW